MGCLPLQAHMGFRQTPFLNKRFQLTIDCFSSLSCLLISGGFLLSSSLISRSNSLINLEELESKSINDHYNRKTNYSNSQVITQLLLIKVEHSNNLSKLEIRTRKKQTKFRTKINTIMSFSRY